MMAMTMCLTSSTLFPSSTMGPLPNMYRIRGLALLSVQYTRQQDFLWHNSGCANQAFALPASHSASL